MVVAEFAAVDQSEAAWKIETFRLADHQDDCAECRRRQPCAIYQALRATELSAWRRYLDARLDAGVL